MKRYHLTIRIDPYGKLWTTISLVLKLLIVLCLAVLALMGDAIDLIHSFRREP